VLYCVVYRNNTIQHARNNTVEIIFAYRQLSQADSYDWAGLTSDRPVVLCFICACFVFFYQLGIVFCFHVYFLLTAVSLVMVIMYNRLSGRTRLQNDWLCVCWVCV